MNDNLTGHQKPEISVAEFFINYICNALNEICEKSWD
jgi:hypothetical protein